MTRSEFLTYVKYDFKRSDKDTEIYQALNDTIKDIASREDFGGYQFQSWCPTVAGQEDYALPGTMLRLNHPVRLLEGSATGDSGWQLEKISKSEYDVLEPNPNRTSPSTGLPTKYCIFSDSVLLYPIPDLSTYLIELNWGRTPSDLTGNSDVHSFLQGQWDEIMKWGILMRLYYALGLDEDGMKWERLYEDDRKGLPKMIRLVRDIRGENLGQIEVNAL